MSNLQCLFIDHILSFGQFSFDLLLFPHVHLVSFLRVDVQRKTMLRINTSFFLPFTII